MKRLFTFGCSFTQYWRWPTWADLLGRQAEYYENWGLCGAGNSYIFYSLIECHQRHRLGPGDAVMIMWTNISREDRYVRDRWLEGGNIYWDGHPLGQDYVRQWSCERGYLIRDLATIAATIQLLDHWQCDYQLFSMVPLTQTNHKNDLGDHPSAPAGEDADVRGLYLTTLDQIKPSVLDTVFHGTWFTGNGIPDSNDPRRRDFHPTPIEHMMYLDRVMPDLSIPTADRDWMARCDSLARLGQLDWCGPNRPQGRL